MAPVRRYDRGPSRQGIEDLPSGPGIIGEIAPRHISVMGSITAAGRFIRKTVPEIVEVSERVGVSRALGVPWPLGFAMGEPNNAELQRAVLVWTD